MSDGIIYIMLVENPTHPSNVWITSVGTQSARDYLGVQPASIPGIPYAFEYAGAKFNREVAYKWLGGNSVETRLLLPVWIVLLGQGIAVLVSLRLWYYFGIRGELYARGFQINRPEEGNLKKDRT